MRKILAMAILLVATAPAIAADNAVVATPGSGLVMRSRDTTGAGGPQQPFVGLGNDSGVSVIGAGSTVPVSGSVTVSGTPTVNQGTPPWTVNPGTAINWGVQGANAATGANGVNILCAATTGVPTYTTGQSSYASCDLAGNLRVVVAGASGGTSSNFGSAFPTPGTAVGFTDGTNMVAGRVTPYGTAPTGFNALAVNAFVTNANPNNQTTMANSAPVVLASNQQVGDPCTFQLKTNQAFNTTTNLQLVAGVAAKKVYVCALSMIANAAVAVSIVEGSGSVCATSPAAVIGSSTAVASTNGLQLAANGGMTFGGGHATVASSNTSTNALCLLVSSAVLVSGNLTYVQQ
jgi:hypothetical protein